MVQRASGTYRDGRIELDQPVDWVDGMRVVIESEEESWDVDCPDAPMTPEEIEKRIAAIDAIEPLELTDAEVAEIDAARKQFGDYTIEAVKKQMGL